MKKMPLRIFSVLLGLSAVILFVAALRAPQKVQSNRAPKVQLSGKAASDYLEKSTDGRSLRQALTAARFGLRWAEHAPLAEASGGGYLGMSHDQNLNAWFDDEGVTVRPTLPEEKRNQAWSMALQLKAYGYGKQLSAVPPIVSRRVKENRIEYQRSSNQQSAINNQQLVEWYENRAEGIEQGFTLNERPERSSDAEVAWASSPYPIGKMPMPRSEALRVLLAVMGDLRARPKDETTIELAKVDGKGALSYSKLVATDANGKRLASRMEASADGREIALVVEDAGARYPIVIDPIVASLEKKLEAFTAQQAEARFGTSVAIDGNRAVVGAWREDFGATVDVGVVYTFSRSGTTWTLTSRNNSGSVANDQCGWSVAISGTRIVYGCPGANSNTGKAFLRDVSNGQLKELVPDPFGPNQGDRFGTSVTIDGNTVAVGSPNFKIALEEWGAVYLFDANGAYGYGLGSVGKGSMLGASISLKGNILIAGAPGKDLVLNGATLVDAGVAVVYVVTPSANDVQSQQLTATNAGAGDNFGNSVALSGNTAVIGAWGNDEKGTDAGAAYVFVRGTNGTWSQQQKLTASDGNATNYFSNNAVAIEGNTIVVGAYAWDGGTPPFILSDDNRGAAYVFTRSGTVWTEQTRMSGEAAGDSFGISVDISRDTVIAGARGATAFGIARAGAAYVYRLDCVPPYASQTQFAEGDPLNKTVCPGSFIGFASGYLYFGSGVPSVQWRKNGVAIQGATKINFAIPSVSASDAGSYDFVVSNSCGSDTSNAVTLSLHSFSLDPTSQNLGVSGSNGIVKVTATGSTCPWVAGSNASFISINSGNSGTGSGTVGFTVGANPNPGQRTGTIRIAGILFTVTQDGTNCSYSVAPTSQTLSASASTNTVNVTASAGCIWAATSNDPSFLSINSGASGSGNGTVTYTIAANSTTVQRTGTLTIAGQTFTVTQSAAGLVANVSTRLQIGKDDDALFEGFIIQGPAGSTKKIIVRALGPFLGPFGVPDPLANPTLDIFQGSNRVATNNDWRTTQLGGIITADQSTEIATGGFAPSNELESAIIANLTPGNFTAIVRGLGNTTGIGLVDAFDLSASSSAKVVNFATRGLVQPADKLLTAGFIIQNGPVRAVIRAIGPSLVAFNITNALPDTTLQLRDQNGGLVQENDDWESDQRQELLDTGLQPTNAKEAALVRTIPPGQYTAQVRGKPESTGIGVVEIYFIQ